jgi:predicted RNase H-like HicB family nuclease
MRLEKSHTKCGRQKVLVRDKLAAHIAGVKYRVTVVKSEEGFAVWCDDLPGCCSQGVSKKEALENIRESIRDYLEAQGEFKSRSGEKILHETVTV